MQFINWMSNPEIQQKIAQTVAVQQQELPRLAITQQSPILIHSITEQPESIIAQLKATIQRLSLRQKSLGLELETSEQMLQKCRQENARLLLKIEQLQTQVMKEEHRSTNEQDPDPEADHLSLADDPQDNFGIGDEEINIGQAETNLQLKESFNTMRCAVEKLLNEEEVSVGVVQVLPRQLEDDFLDFISYVKEKLQEIKKESNLSFIAAEEGEEPSLQQIEDELEEFLSMTEVQCGRLRRVIEERDCTINSLMNEKTEQENTINEQQATQEETERLYLQQFAVLKNEVKQLKQTIDHQTVYSESLRNFFKKTMQLWLDDEDNYDDFEDNLKLLTTIYTLNQKELELLRKYLAKYRQLKGIE